jgi:pimeloyl-ACP methyl ester carboxylesterase
VKQRSPTRRRITIAVATIAVSYLALCGIARVAYPRILFPAPRMDAPLPVPGATLLDLPQKQGRSTRALHWPARGDARTVVFFHGNGQTMYDETGLAEELSSRGLGVVLVEYRGYGISYGDPPTEESLYADAEVVLDYLASIGVGRERVALWGFSLGTGVAAEMARRDRAARVVLVAPYTSIVDMGKSWAPFLPVSLIMSHRFDTLAKAPSIKAPTLVAHGDADEVVPYAMGEKVAHAIPGAKLVTIAGGHHMDLLLAKPGLLEEIVDHVSR